jgi:Lrp/AsnC family transcriptional regulator, regulator for asnA, asnC and gidA
MDRINRAIIKALKEDGRMPYSRIAEQLGVSPGMIRQRVQRLNDQGILQVVAVTNPLKIGYHSMAFIGVKAEGQRLQEIARKIAAFDEVIYLTICSGAYNLLVEVLCLDNSHLLSFLTEKLYSVEGVRDTETFIYLDIVKEIYAWDSPAPAALGEELPLTNGIDSSDTNTSSLDTSAVVPQYPVEEAPIE